MFTCSICQEFFTSSSHLSGLHCGHVYHEICISTWLKDHNTCPQCRCKLKDKQFRIYFTIDCPTPGQSVDINEKYAVLSAKFEAIQEEMNKTKIILSDKLECIRKLQLQFWEQEAKTQEKSSELGSLQLEMARLNQKVSEMKKTTGEVEKLRAENEDMLGIKNILNSTSAEVSKLLSQTPRTPTSFRQLCTYIEVIKQQAEKTKQKNKELALEIVVLTKELKQLKNASGNLSTRKPRLSSSSLGVASKIKPMSPSAGFNHSPRKAPAERRAMSILHDAAFLNDIKPIEKVKNPATVAANLGARPKTVTSNLLQKSAATKRGNVVFNGMGGSGNMTLGSPTPREEFMAIRAKRVKPDSKSTSFSLAPKTSSRSNPATPGSKRNPLFLE